jgi:hypothetical protein
MTGTKFAMIGEVFVTVSAAETVKLPISYK